MPPIPVIAIVGLALIYYSAAGIEKVAKFAKHTTVTAAKVTHKTLHKKSKKGKEKNVPSK